MTARRPYGSGSPPRCLSGGDKAKPTRPRSRENATVAASDIPDFHCWRRCATLPQFYVTPAGDVFVEERGDPGRYIVLQARRAQKTFSWKGAQVKIAALIRDAFGQTP